ncbi:MAG TPA: LegC family aminotransferase [Actinomycetota bacterium]|nr:LegC family aminotransferase [Actinomycetota bacterium]
MSETPIPLCVPHLAGNEWLYVKECLDTNWVSSVGLFVDRFEREMAEVADTKYAVATVNGTAALHTALMLAGVEPGDEVLVSDLTFIAPANAIRYMGAHPVFVDAEPDYWQMDVRKLKDFLERGCDTTARPLRNKATGRRVRALLPVHILGSVCDMGSIVELGNRFGLPVIEDATEALGAKYGGHPAGSLGVIGCFSFNGNKILTTGGGGMLVTNDETLAQRARYLTTQAKDDPQEFVHGEVGYNYRLPNVLAAIGCAQLEQLDRFIARKREIAAAYTDALADLPGVAPMREPLETFSTFWLYTICLDEPRARLGSRDLMKALNIEGIQARPLWQPMHMSPAHPGASATDCTVAERLNRECLSIPCSAGITEPQQQTVGAILREMLIGKSRPAS